MKAASELLGEFAVELGSAFQVDGVAVPRLFVVGPLRFDVGEQQLAALPARLARAVPVSQRCVKYTLPGSSSSLFIVVVPVGRHHRAQPTETRSILIAGSVDVGHEELFGGGGGNGEVSMTTTTHNTHKIYTLFSKARDRTVTSGA